MFKQFINENKKIFIILVISLILNMFLFFLIALPLHGRAGEMNEKNRELAEKIAVLKEDWVQKGKKASNLEETVAVLKELEASIPEKENGLKGFISQINDWNIELDLNINDIVLSYENMENSILKVKTNLKIMSSYENLKKLLFYLDTHDKLMAAESLSINEFSDQEGKVEMQIGLMAYFSEEEA